METSTGQSKTRIIASTNVFQIEKIEQIGKADYPKLIEISLHLAKEYGSKQSSQKLQLKNTLILKNPFLLLQDIKTKLLDTLLESL